MFGDDSVADLEEIGEGDDAMTVENPHSFVSVGASLFFFEKRWMWDLLKINKMEMQVFLNVIF